MVKIIMVVDDKQDIILTVRQALGIPESEFVVIGANSGKECFELLKEGQIPDLILLDIIMPEMTGWEIFGRIKENLKWRDIPIVFLTARTSSVAKNAGSFLGEDYIEKPFEGIDLKKRIDKVLNS